MQPQQLHCAENCCHTELLCVSVEAASRYCIHTDALQAVRVIAPLRVGSFPEVDLIPVAGLCSTMQSHDPITQGWCCSSVHVEVAPVLHAPRPRPSSLHMQCCRWRATCEVEAVCLPASSELSGSVCQPAGGPSQACPCPGATAQCSDVSSSAPSSKASPHAMLMTA